MGLPDHCYGRCRSVALVHQIPPRVNPYIPEHTRKRRGVAVYRLLENCPNKDLGGCGQQLHQPWST